MANTRNSKNTSTKKVIVKANLKSNLKKNPPNVIAQPNTPRIDIPMAAIITPNKPQKEKKKVDTLTSLMVLDLLQTSNHNHSIPAPDINPQPINPTPSLVK